MINYVNLEDAVLIKGLVSRLLRGHGKLSFLSYLPENSKILDVGCGNDSPYRIKSVLAKCEYTGIDIGDYNQSKPNLANHYILTSPENFSNEILRMPARFDAVVSAHNLEHCNDRKATFLAMIASLKKGGRIFLSFPCEGSVYFPNRKGTLNYFDDETHKYAPPSFEELIEELRTHHFEIIFSSRNYKPKILWAIGLMLEPISLLRKRVMRGTWEFYGFESVIWAKKI